MVRGLDQFKKHFAPFRDRYVLIGGTACAVAMEEAGLNFRATRDLDIVLCVEALDREFGMAFWQFIQDGGYQYQQQSTGAKLFYRFKEPRNQDYPEMLELFSRIPQAMKVLAGSHLTPIPIDEEVSSLSAILLDKDYYAFIHAGKREIEGLSLIGPEYLIPLKARAWMDLSDRRAAGAVIDEKNIRKHKNDIYRLYQLLSPSHRITLPQSVKLDMQKFLDLNKINNSVDLKNLGLKNTTLPELLDNLSQIYNCGSQEG